MLEPNEVMVKEIKVKVKKEYCRRVRKVLETNLNNRIIFKAINTWAISVLMYSAAAFLGWLRLQLEEIDRRVGKMLTINDGFYHKSNVDWLHLSRSEGSRGLIGVQDTVGATLLGLINYLSNSKERLLTAARTIEDDEDRETPNEYKRKRTEWKEM